MMRNVGGDDRREESVRRTLGLRLNQGNNGVTWGQKTTSGLFYCWPGQSMRGIPFVRLDSLPVIRKISLARPVDVVVVVILAKRIAVLTLTAYLAHQQGCGVCVCSGGGGMPTWLHCATSDSASSTLYFALWTSFRSSR